MAQTDVKNKGKASARRTGAAAERVRRAKVDRGIRWVIQIVFFLMAPAIFSSAFAGMKYIFTQIGSGQPVELAAFDSILFALLAFTIIFGRFFCGYACAFGTLGDFIYLIFKPIRKLLHIKDKPFSDKVNRILQKIKYVLLVLICLMCFLGTWSYISPYSPWTAFAALDALSVDGIAAGAFVLLVTTIVIMGLSERSFCQYFCPMGATFALMPVLPFSLYSRKKKHCAKNCGICKKGCPVQVYPDQDDVMSGECISCGKCADSCPFSNISLVGTENPKVLEAQAAEAAEQGRPEPGKKAHVRGTEIWVVVVKAVLLLALFFVFDMLNFVPGLHELFPGIDLPWL